MNEAEVVRELSHKTGLPQSAAEAVLRALREMMHDGLVNMRLPIAKNDLEDVALVDDVIARARRHPLGIEFLLDGHLAAVAISLQAHAFTVEAARARLRSETCAS